ncbi:hypothetical protein [Cupriavidus sp. UYPR2.512]|uniref:hypothetical protein n=1 Tax=Cupriavidus sp. UYPR2.512 TaxID=1080187 RepID=UPI0012F9119A|nr:hypothetical protein [Cupriavidus sp. UYPR2.512]UIF86285.1 hypothetical protein KAF44_00855 [Cupriavidus necator]
MTNIVVNVTTIVVQNSVVSGREAAIRNDKPASVGNGRDFWQKYERLIFFAASCVFQLVLRYYFW